MAMLCASLTLPGVDRLQGPPEGRLGHEAEEGGRGDCSEPVTKHWPHSPEKWEFGMLLNGSQHTRAPNCVNSEHPTCSILYAVCQSIFRPDLVLQTRHSQA